MPSTFDDIENEAEEGVWGYLIPLDQKYGKSLVLRKRKVCPDETEQDGKEEQTPRTKAKAAAAGGYLIGRHPECGKSSNISNQDRSLNRSPGRSYYRPSHCIE